MVLKKRDLKWTNEMTAGVLRIARANPDNTDLQERVNAALLYLQIRGRPSRWRSYQRPSKATKRHKRRLRQQKKSRERCANRSTT